MYPLLAQATEATSPSVGDFLQAYWPILAPVVAGFVGVYFLLPQAGRFKPLWGALVAAAAFIAGGILVIHCDMVLPETILFYTFSAIAILGGVMLISQTNPVHAALSFALVVLSTCGLFLLQGAPFLMASTIIVYAGAIIVTFLFVIMLAQQAGLDSADQRSREPFLGALAGFILLGAILCVLQRTYDTSKLDAYLTVLQQAANAKTMDEVYQLIPNQAKPDDDFPRTDFFDKLGDDLKNPFDVETANTYWLGKDLAKFRTEARKLHDTVLNIRQRQGSLQPQVRLADKNKAPARDESKPRGESSSPAGEPGKEKLPVHNVAGLGRTLFTDYLLPVELAGVLLLVASIGAIVIAGRRSPEGRA